MANTNWRTDGVAISPEEMRRQKYMACIREALEPYGFINGQYGDVPIEITKALELPSWAEINMDGDSIAGTFRIWADRRQMGMVTVLRGGRVIVHLRMAEWLRADSAPEAI
jgi:hypothetical protein